jgi:hypothetical protein
MNRWCLMCVAGAAVAFFACVDDGPEAPPLTGPVGSTVPLPVPDAGGAGTENMAGAGGGMMGNAGTGGMGGSDADAGDAPDSGSADAG